MKNCPNCGKPRMSDAEAIGVVIFMLALACLIFLAILPDIKMDWQDHLDNKWRMEHGRGHYNQTAIANARLQTEINKHK